MTIGRIPIDLLWTGASGSPGVNVFHARWDNDPLEGTLEQQVESLETFYQDIAGIFPSAVTARWAGLAYGVGPDEGTLFEGEPWTVAGSGGTNFAPPADAMLVQWRTAAAGRSGRGRSFISPLNTGLIEANGTPTEEGRAVLADAAADLVSRSLEDLNGALGVWSRTDNVLRDFTASAVPNYFAVLRSRRD